MLSGTFFHIISLEQTHQTVQKGERWHVNNAPTSLFDFCYLNSSRLKEVIKHIVDKSGYHTSHASTLEHFPAYKGMTETKLGTS